MDHLARQRGKPKSGKLAKGRGQIGVSHATSASSGTNFHGFVCRRPSKAKGSRRSSKRIDRERGSRGSNKSKLARVLRKAFHKTETRESVEINHRSGRPEFIHHKSYFSDGNRQNNTGEFTTRSVGDLCRSDRCLLPPSNTPKRSEIPKGRFVRQGFPICSATNGVVDFGEGFQQNRVGNTKASKTESNTYSQLFRRLVNKERKPKSAHRTHKVGVRVMSRTGLAGKPKKVGIGSQTDFDLRGGSVRFCKGAGNSSAQQSSGIDSVNRVDPSKERLHSENMGKTHWENGGSHAPDSFRTPSQETHPEILTRELVSGVRGLGPIREIQCRSRKGVGLVVKDGESNGGSEPRTVQTRFSHIHRRQRGRVRGDSERQAVDGSLGKRRKVTSLQQQRNVSYDKGNKPFPQNSPRQKCLDLLRQHISNRSNKQTRGHKVVVPNRPGLEILGKCRSVGVQCTSQTHPGEIKCVGGLPVKEISDNRDRMVDFSGSPSSGVDKVGETGNRSVRDSLEFQTSEICVADSGSESMESERDDVQMDGGVNVRVSTLANVGGSPPQSLRRPGRTDIDSAGLESEAVVSAVIGSGSGAPVNSSTDPTIADSAPLRSETLKSKVTESSCMEIIREDAREKGFDEGVANRLGKGVRDSSNCIYSSKWKSFAKWVVKSENINPLDSDVKVVSKFLNMLFEQKGLDVSTIRGYRASISRVLRFVRGLDLTNSLVLRELISSFELERPCVRKLYPKWDLNTVLKALMRGPYEPLNSASMLHLTRKTAFLLLLASGARRGELMALDVKYCLSTNEDKSVFLKPNWKFMPKNFNPSNGKGKFEGFIIHKLRPFVGNDLPEDLTLCPVRALNIYLKRSEKRRNGIRQLFITCNRIAKPAHKNTLSSWIKHTIAEAYQTAPENATDLLYRSTHEIRSIAASLAAYSNVAIEDILRQCRWRAQSTFSTFYLKDVSGTSKDISQFLPLVVAGSVLPQKSGSKGQ